MSIKFIIQENNDLVNLPTWPNFESNLPSGEANIGARLSRLGSSILQITLNLQSVQKVLDFL